MEKKERLYALDALRGLAVLVIVMSHTVVYVNHHIGPKMGSDFSPAYALLPHSLSHFALHFFFMLSGFVIFLTLVRCRSGMDFAVARFSRLIPAFWASILITWFFLLLVPVYFPREIPVWDMLLNFTLMPRYLGVESVNGAYWSMGLILIFYVVALLLYITRLTPHIEALCLAYLVFMGVLLNLEAAYGRIPSYTFRTFFLNFNELFILGVMFFRLWKEGPSLFRWTVIAAAWVINVMSAPDWNARFGHEPVVVLGLMLLLYLAIRRKLDWLAWRPLLWLGGISYSLYLVHHTIAQAVAGTLILNGYPTMFSVALAVVLVLLLAAAVTKWVSRPANTYLRQVWNHHQEQKRVQQDTSKQNFAAPSERPKT